MAADVFPWKVLVKILRANRAWIRRHFRPVLNTLPFITVPSKFHSQILLQESHHAPVPAH